MACDFQQCGILTSVDSDESVQFVLILEIPNDVQPVAYHSYNIQATRKGSDQSASMGRLVQAFAGHTYHIVGNIMSWLKYSFFPNIFHM